jgi:hypothetical protein
MTLELEDRRIKDVPHPAHYIAISSAHQAQHIQFAAICAVLEQIVSSILAVPREELSAARRGRAPVAFARQVAMYLAHVGLGLSLTRVGALFGRDRTTVAHGCAVVEDRREDPAFDRALGIVESVLRAALVRGVNSGGNPW